MSIYDEMVAERAERVGTATPNAEQEVMQRIALAGSTEVAFSSMQLSVAALVCGSSITCHAFPRTWTSLW